MAHTEESLGRDDVSDEFGGSIGWTALLRKYTAKGTAPFINLGHFGGDTPKIDANGVSTNNQWPASFSALMKQNAGHRMYGDFGYWTALRACALDNRDSCDQVMNRIDRAKEAFPGLDARLMYGTDWLMLSKETDWPVYAQYVAAALKGSVDSDKFFYKNAIECFGLGRNGGQRRRIVQRFGEENLPGWLASA